MLPIIASGLLFSVVCSPAAGASEAGPPRPALTEMVAMRDGTRLATDVYLPAGGEGSWPALLVRTTYGKKGYGPEFGSWVGKGYAMVIQDVRGRFDSQGADLAFLNCGNGQLQDGHDTIAWIARQKWCNGRVGTVGASAMGITQTLLAPDAPEPLVAQYILVAAGSLYHEATYESGALRLEMTGGWLIDNRYHPANLWLTVMHPFYDRHWQRVDANAQADRIHVPSVFYGGWFDAFLVGIIDTWQARQHHGGAGARGTQKLLIGPWCHGGPGTDAKPARAGELTFPANSRRLPCPIGGQEWFAHYLLGEDNGADRAPAVVYYTMGAVGEEGAPGNVWRMESDWPPPATITPYHLHSDGSLSPDPLVAAEGSRTFAADPANPVPTRGGHVLCLPQGTYDQREIEAHADVLVYTTSPLEEPLEVTGPLVASLHISSDSPDTDLAVKLCDVYPDGRSMIICDGVCRVRYRKGLDRLDLLQPGQIVPVQVRLTPTSLVFNRGHRIRVTVAGSNYPRYDVNPNTGWPAWPFCPTRVAHNTLYSSTSHPSAVHLPVIRRDGR